MLKYRINKSNLINDSDLITVNNKQILDLDINGISRYNAKKCMICYTNDIAKLSANARVVSRHTLTTSFTDYYPSTYEYYEIYDIVDINKLTSSFSFMFNKYMQLEINRIYKETIYEDDANDNNEEETLSEEEDNKTSTEYLCVVFTLPHFFDLDEANKVVMINYNGEFRPMVDFEIVTNTSIRFKWEDITKNYSFIERLFNGDDTEADISVVEIYRENYCFTYLDDFILYFNNPKCRIPIGFTTNTQTDLLKEQMVSDYVADAKIKCINEIVDMEKDIYYPSNPKTDNTTIVNKIRFNLHFRERKGENWITENDSYWNGVGRDKNNKLSFIENFFSYKNPENQSDLLTYLNFTNNDVRYQKNKLKKSFLRLSFYDSMNEGNQNLLSYSTIFFNSGDFFNKYIRFIEEPSYTQISQEGELIGIRVDREHNFKEKDDNEEYRLSSQIVVNDKYSSTASSEGFYIYLWRDLLTNLTDEQKKNGLDIYLKVEFNHAGYGRIVPFMMPYWDKKKWGESGIKTFQEILDDWNSKLIEIVNVNGRDYEVMDERTQIADYVTIKKTINIKGKVEKLKQEGDKFYYEDNEKTKYYVTKAWKLGENKYTDGQYGAKQYNKFSYIHFKIKYCEKENRYIYFLDTDFYGEVPSYNDNILTLNLYEAKMA